MRRRVLAWINRISWLLFVVLIFGIIGCSQTQAPSSQPQTPVVPAPTPAIFEVTQLLVSPLQVQVNEAVKITITITNSGSSVGIYPLVLKINDVKHAEENIIISSGSTETTRYSSTVNKAGNYNVTVGELSASFTVVAPVYSPPSYPTYKPSAQQQPAYSPPPVYNPPAIQDNFQWQLDELRRQQQQQLLQQQQELKRQQDEQKRQMREYYMGLSNMYLDMAKAAEAQAEAIDYANRGTTWRNRIDNPYTDLASQYRAKYRYYILEASKYE